MDIMQHTLNKILLILNAQCAKTDINPSMIPGFNDPLPIRRSLSPHSIPNSPNAQSSSPGLGISSLALSDAQSSASAHSAFSMRSGEYFGCISNTHITLISHSSARAAGPEHHCRWWRFQCWGITHVIHWPYAIVIEVLCA
jgi:hypothetical protein